jgi:hypothetical protein
LAEHSIQINHRGHREHRGRLGRERNWRERKTMKRSGSKKQDGKMKLEPPPDLPQRGRKGEG